MAGKVRQYKGNLCVSRPLFTHFLQTFSKSGSIFKSKGKPSPLPSPKGRGGISASLNYLSAKYQSLFQGRLAPSPLGRELGRGHFGFNANLSTPIRPSIHQFATAPWGGQCDNPEPHRTPFVPNDQSKRHSQPLQQLLSN